VNANTLLAEARGRMQNRRGSVDFGVLAVAYRPYTDSDRVVTLWGNIAGVSPTGYGVSIRGGQAGPLTMIPVEQIVDYAWGAAGVSRIEREHVTSPAFVQRQQ
jgi:hypothetical protein